jgi:hypothetical protein
VKHSDSWGVSISGVTTIPVGSRTTRNLDSHLAGMNSCDWVLKNEPADVCRPQGNQSDLNDIFDKELLQTCCTLRCKWDLSAQLRSC